VIDIAIGDLNGDGKDDVAAIDIGGGTVHAISGPDGTPLWYNDSAGGLAIDIGDIDGNPSNEVIAGGYNDTGTTGITAYDSNGNFPWFYPTQDIVFDIEIGDVSGDGDNEVVIGIAGGVLAFNGTNDAEPDNPDPIYDFFTGDEVTNIELGDLDGEPGVEVVSMGIGGFSLYAIDIDAPEGEQEMWTLKSGT